MAQSKKKEAGWGKPGAFAVCRNQADGDICAAALLYRIKFRFSPKFKKLTRFNKEWIAMSRDEWAREAGLSTGEMKNRALPKVRSLPFVEVRQMKLKPNGPKLLWIHLAQHAIYENTMPWDMYENRLEGFEVIGSEGKKTYPYKKTEIDC